jgi:hypothetical protein
VCDHQIAPIRRSCRSTCRNGPGGASPARDPAPSVRADRLGTRPTVRALDHRHRLPRCQARDRGRRLWAWRIDADRFRADRRKGNALVRAGWQQLRFTWHDLTNRPAYVIAEIHAALLAAATA